MPGTAYEPQTTNSYGGEALPQAANTQISIAAPVISCFNFFIVRTALQQNIIQKTILRILSEMFL